MAVLIDASILIAAERGVLDLAAHVSERQDEDYYLSVVTAGEMLHGVERARSAEQRARRSAFVEAVLDRFPLLELDMGTARAHAGISAELASRGALIGAHDLWLAATCIAHGMSIATADIRDFSRVPGLSVQVWEDVELANPA